MAPTPGYNVDGADEDLNAGVVRWTFDFNGEPVNEPEAEKRVVGGQLFTELDDRDGGLVIHGLSITGSAYELGALL